MRDKINHKELAQAIRTMSVRSQLYKTLKTELSARGWWKDRARWQPPKGKLTQKGDSTKT